MNAEAGIAEPPPQTTTGADPQGGPASPGLAAAAKAHAEWERTGRAPDQPIKKEPVQKKADTPPKNDEHAKGAIAEIKPKTAPPAKSQEQLKKEAAAKDAEKAEALKKAQPGAAAEDEQKQQTRWKELKAKEEELERLRPEFDATKKEKEAWLKEKAEFDKKLKRLEELERKEAFTDVTQTKRYQEEVEIPFARIQDKAEEVAKYAEIDLRVLMKAMQEPNALLREDKIKEALDGAKREVKPGNIAILVQHGDEMKDIFAKMDKFHKDAEQEKGQWENEQKAEKLRVDTETKQIMETAQKEAMTILKTNASDVLSEDDISKAFERAKVRRSEPMDDAFRNVSEFLVPTLIEKNREKDARISELEEDLKAALAARPGIDPTKDKKPAKEAPYGSLKEAADAHKAAGGHL